MDIDIFDKDVVCPVCKNEFKSKKIKTSHVKVTKVHPDFYTEYGGENPNHYSIFVCPRCGYSAFDSDFDSIGPKAKLAVQEKITVNWKSRNFGERRNVNSAIETYKLALLNYNVIGAKNSTIAKIALRLSWLYRELSDQESELRYIRLALTYFEKAFTEDKRTEAEKMEELQIMLFCGELNRRLKNYQESVKWFSTLMREPEIKKVRHIELKAKELWQCASDEYRKLGGNQDADNIK